MTKQDLEGVYVEEVLEEFCGRVVRSNLRKATMEDFKASEELHKVGKCPHNLIVDEHGWLYDIRYCFVCGTGLGTV